MSGKASRSPAEISASAASSAAVTGGTSQINNAYGGYVTDGGPGIPDGVLDRLYEAFFSTKSDGMGIGLSLCRSIIESHRGRMRAENIYNDTEVTGCRFTFTLPVELDPDYVPTTRSDPPLDLITDSP